MPHARHAYVLAVNCLVTLFSKPLPNLHLQLTHVHAHTSNCGNKMNNTNYTVRAESVVVMGGTSVSCKLRVQNKA